MGEGTRKPFLEIGGLPVIIHTLRALHAHPRVTEILPVLKAEDADEVLRLARSHGLERVWRAAPGGAERQDSVWSGISMLDDQTDIVLVHDAVRPFVDTSVVDAVIDTAAQGYGAIPVVPVKDTIKTVDGEGRVTGTPERDSLRAVQTPQAFPCALLRKAFESARAEGYYATDEAALVERIGGTVLTVEGSYENIKITTPEDIELAESIYRQRETRREAAGP